MRIDIKDIDIGKQIRDFQIIDKSHQGNNIWICECVCGNQRHYKASYIATKIRQSCGCHNDHKRHSKYINKKFHMKTITGFSNKNKYGNRFYFYTCDCGYQGKVVEKEIRSNISCGCHYKKGMYYQDICGKYWKQIKNNAKTRKYEFTITQEYVWMLYQQQNRKCALSGLDIDFQNRTNIHHQTASLDRIDSTKGYVEGNVQWLHKDINWLKGTWSEEELLKMCTLIVNHNKLSKGV